MTWSQSASRPVVVRCDGSSLSQDAVATATRHAARHGAPLVLLATHADHARPESRSGSRRHPAPLDDPKAVGERAWWRANHTDPSVAVQIMTVTDLHSPRVARLAQRARLLVVSGADVVGADSSDATAWGSLGRSLDRLFHCPVLVAGPPVTEEPRKHRAVIVGFSGRPEDAELMPTALAEAQLRGQDVVVVRAVPTAEELEPAMEDSWTALNTYCRDVPCRVVHLVASPARALADQSGPGDLLVIGSRSASPLGHLTHGTTGHETLRRSRCDVLVLPLNDVATESTATESEPFAVEHR